MRKFLIMSTVVLGMAALTTTEVKAKGGMENGGDSYPEPPIKPAYPLPTPYPGGPIPWEWKPWENPNDPKP